ncbi:hypothetical protein [Campylobacter concisus]|nr:hypothetical protein [Campylobacter concisus]
MKYDTDRFYKISAFFDDNFCFMSRVIEIIIGIDRKRVDKDLSFGRYKPEYLDALEGVRADFKADPMKPYKEAVLTTIPKTDVIFSRDDFANIEAYSVFERSYDKTGKAKREKVKSKTKRPRRVKKEQLEFKF